MTGGRNGVALTNTPVGASNRLLIPVAGYSRGSDVAVRDAGRSSKTAASCVESCVRHLDFIRLRDSEGPCRKTGRQAGLSVAPTVAPGVGRTVGDATSVSRSFQSAAEPDLLCLNEQPPIHEQLGADVRRSVVSRLQTSPSSPTSLSQGSSG